MRRQIYLSKVLAMSLLVLLCCPETSLISSLSGSAREPVSDTNTEIQFLIYHVQPKASFRPLLRDLITAFQRPARSGQIHWIIAAANEKNVMALRESTGLKDFMDFDSHSHWLVVPEAYNTWARDLYTVFRKSGHYEVLPLFPGEKKTGESFTQILPESKSWSTLPAPAFQFAGGDLTADDRFVYLGEKSIKKFIERKKFKNSEEVKIHLEKIFGKELIILPGDDEHQDRYHLPVGMIQGKRTSLLADPVLTMKVLRQLSAEEKENAIQHYAKIYTWQAPGKTRLQMERFFSRIEIEADDLASCPYVQSLDRVEKTLQSHGIRVIRIPTLNRKLIPEDPFPLGFYYVNLIQDTYEDLDGRPKRKFILPAYGIETLDRTVFEMIKALEEIHEIRMVKAEIEGFRGAGIRCLLQVMGPHSTLSKKETLQ